MMSCGGGGGGVGCGCGFWVVVGCLKNERKEK